MVEIEELRIGSLVVNAINKEIIRVSGVSDNDYITIRKNVKEEKIEIKNIEPLYLEPV
jgi:5-bromo-4-chloroindolyl phosphate hydrolysis protein